MSYPSVILATGGLAAYWRFAEAAGGPYLDEVFGLSVAGSSIGHGTSLVASQPSDPSLHGDSLSAPSGAFSAGNYTWGAQCSIEAWIRPDVYWSNIGIAGAWSSSGGAMLSTPVTVTGSSRIRFYTGGASFLDSGYDAPDDTITHIVGTFDGTSRRIYINGALVAGPTSGLAPTGAFSKVVIGNYVGSGVNGHLGDIDDVSFYDRALTDAEVLEHYLAGLEEVAPTAEFSYLATAPLTIAFSDESTDGPTSWLWDFGDGHTSTGQNPDHIYAAAGTYTVTLTATNDTGSDSVSHDIGVVDTPVYVPPLPGLAILEIYVKDPASPRWDLANWDEAAWGSSGWVDVTPQGVSVKITWGTTRPEFGILSTPEAANWYVTFYDPDRILDPANTASPYYSDLRPGLPIRIRHRGVTVQTGHADVIGHSMKPGANPNGIIRGSDIISKMARAMVPADASLGDTLYDRARDAIAAAGLDISVYTGGFFGPDPDLGAKLTGEKTVWAHILDAAQAVLVYPYVTRDARLAFRKFLIPANSGKVIASPNLIDLNSIVDTAGLFSEVHVSDTPAGGLGTITPAITPPPWFGRRVYERLQETPDPEAWADAVLADRSGAHGIRWVPGEVYPLTADDVEYFAKIDPGELVTLRMLETAPAIEASVLVLGGTITAEPRANDSVEWRFTYEAAASDAIPIIGAPQRLTLDGGGPTDYLLNEAGSDYLYEDA